ncbi:PREDICTED: unnamed product [Prunus dulcis]|uniref:PREDICTED: unnamed product n=1 Tax=Prunus dulcis TaxID=3755 RepID=A0A5E4EDG2_PRUDU|nr:PREDICTED: unnamed product [Prunus dulcis]
MCPFMLLNGIGQIRFRDTCAEAEEFFKEKKIMKLGERKACTKLLDVCTDILPSKVKGDRSKSVLFDACRLAKALQSLESDRGGTNGRKWQFVSHVWVEMLPYAANQCRRSGQAQQLRRGGELLTHVWLLMAHLGLTEQFQISEGHARAKLIVEFFFF